MENNYKKELKYMLFITFIYFSVFQLLSKYILYLHLFPIIVKDFSTKNLSKSLFIFISFISLIVLSIDYYSVEARQAKIWMPLALQIRNEVPIDQRIVSVSRVDPTLLNLGRRQGWLTSSKNVTQENIDKWFNEGATFLAGSLNWNETYSPLKEIKEKLNGSPNPK